MGKPADPPQRVSSVESFATHSPCPRTKASPPSSAKALKNVDQDRDVDLFPIGTLAQLPDPSLFLLCNLEVCFISCSPFLGWGMGQETSMPKATSSGSKPDASKGHPKEATA